MDGLSLSPHARATHWSAVYVGMLWRRHFTCWLALQLVQREQWGRVVPDLPEAGDAQAERAALLRALVRHPQWQPVAGDVLASAREGDVLLMQGPDGPHVGTVVQRPGRPLELLHNLGGVVKDARGVEREHGSVRIDAVAALGALGYGHLRAWRATA